MTVFLDRDGLLNQDPGKAYYVRSLRQFRWIPGVFGALRKLTESGARLVVVSNQAGVGKGLVKPEALDAITKKIFLDLAAAGVKLDGIFYCTHTPEDACGCRKPKAGLFRAAQKQLKLSKTDRFMVGDTERDLAAGRAAGCRTVLVLSGKTRTAAEVKKFDEKPDHTARNLREAAQWILSQKKS
jgi:histidinol-phosphate phosphatase family protein